MAVKEKSSRKQPTGSDSSSVRLCRSETERIFAGVAGGLAEFFNADPTLVRLIFVLFTIFGGSGIALYLVLWLIIPGPDSGKIISDDTVRENIKEMKIKTKEAAEEIRAHSHGRTIRAWVGWFLLLIGVSLLMENFGIRVFRVFRLWPLILVVIAWNMLSKD